MSANPTAIWWVIGSTDKTQFVGWSCGSLGPLVDAAIYRSEDNAEKKLKSLRKYEPFTYRDMVLYPLGVELEA